MYKLSKTSVSSFVACLTVLLVCISLVPETMAIDSSNQQKGLAVADQVLNLDLSKYSVKTEEYPQNSYFNVVAQENIAYEFKAETGKLKLLYTYANGNLRMISVLESETSGIPYTKVPVSDTATMAIEFLDNYQNYSGNTVYGTLRSMLNANDGTANVTKTSGNLKLTITSRQPFSAESKQITTFVWTYKANGLEAASKSVALSYKNGLFDCFVDNWNLHEIGSSEVNLSEEEAKSLALDAAKNFSWKVGAGNQTQEIENFNISKVEGSILFFGDSIMADSVRGVDILSLYPVWRVGVQLDKFYPGNVYGIQVDIWADTKQTRSIQEKYLTRQDESPEFASQNNFAGTLETMDPLKSQLNTDITKPSSTISSIVIILPLSLASLGSVALLLRRRQVLHRPFHLSPFYPSKLLVCFLCLSLSITILLSSLTTAEAAITPNRRATILGAESTGGPPAYPRKTLGEIESQRAVCSYIAERFNLNGYSVENNQGANSLKSTILSRIEYNEQNYLGSAVVDFDHGVGRNDYSQVPNLQWPQGEFHYILEDNVGQDDSLTFPDNHMVYDMDISRRTYLNRTFFAFINTCESADVTEQYPSGSGFTQGWVKDSQTGLDTDRALGMPFAWTHRIVVPKTIPGFDISIHLSDDGYDPAKVDNGPFCYIGFYRGSAALNQTIETEEFPDSKPYSQFVQNFFFHALQTDRTINEALDLTTRGIWGTNVYFDDSPLYKGFEAKWPIPPDEGLGLGWMKVYGNGNLRLFQNKPVATYFLNEGSGPTTSDSSGNGNTGTISGATWLASGQGHEGAALSFDGTNDRVTVNDSPTLNNFAEGLTISAWVKPERPSTNDKNKAICRVNTFEFQPGSVRTSPSTPSTFRFAVNLQGLGMTDLTSTNLVTWGSWQHFACTYDGQKMTLYKNGVETTSRTVAGSISAPGGSLLYLGRDGSGKWYKGAIDEVYVFNHALTKQEIFRLATYSGPTQQTYRSLTVNAFDEYNRPINVAVWIDDKYVGQAGSTFSVISGTHKLQVSKPFGNYVLSGMHWDRFDVYGTANPIQNLQVTSDMTVTARYLGHPPTGPILNGETTAYVGTQTSYNASATDPGDDMTLTFDWGPYYTPTQAPGTYHSGQVAIVTHIWSEAGTYKVIAIARDLNQTPGPRSNVLEITVLDPPPQNQPPTKPTVSGPTSGYVDTSYVFFASSTDPQNDDIKYEFDWNDTSTTITDWYHSTSYTGNTSHAWTATGTKSLKVRAIDYYGAVGNWSDPYTVVINAQPPQYWYISSLNWSGVETPPATVEGAANIVGSSNDGSYTHIHCPDYPGAASIIGNMNGLASGRVTVYGRSGAGGYLSDMYVYVSSNGGTWTQVGSKITVTSTSSYWIDFGVAPISFNYIKIRGYDNANSVCLYLDSVRVTPETPPPDTITTPSVGGPSSGYVGTPYQFNAVSTDSLGHNIQYTFNWGDGSPQTVTGWIASGVTAYATHSWNSPGFLSVTVQAMCSLGVFSSWSSPHVVNIEDSPPLFHTITASADSHSTINPSGPISVAHGSSQAFSMAALTGYHLAHVFVDSIDQGPLSSYTFNDVQSDHTISVTSEINQYTITVTQGAHGTISPGTTVVNHGDSAVFSITADAGYHVADVLVDGNSVGPVTSYTFSNVQADHTLTATFAIDACLVTVNAYAYDSYSNQYVVYPNVYIDGSPVGTAWSSFAVSPGQHSISVDDPHYAAQGWAWDVSFDAGTGGNPTTLTVSSDMTVTASFANWQWYGRSQR
jgi:hypothetical protein